MPFLGPLDFPLLRGTGDSLTRPEGTAISINSKGPVGSETGAVVYRTLAVSAVSGRPSPRRAAPPQIAFGVACCLRRYLASSAPGAFRFRGLVRTFTRRCGPRPCSPRPAGLCRWASPPGFPMSAPPKLCGFDLLPLQDFYLMVSWVPPGITRRIEGGNSGPRTRSRRAVTHLRVPGRPGEAALTARSAR